VARMTIQHEKPAAALRRFIGKFSPPVQAVATQALRKMRARLPSAIELVYDNYNALAIAFGPTERVSDVIFSIALYPRWVSLFFKRGATLPDPQGILKGSGNEMRHIVLETADTLDRPAVRRLMKSAVNAATPKIDSTARRRIVIKSVSAKQRPRRPRPG
jgi:hypothetical protein